jgi:hypothetical protein
MKCAEEGYEVGYSSILTCFRVATMPEKSRQKLAPMSDIECQHAYNSISGSHP